MIVTCECCGHKMGIDISGRIHTATKLKVDTIISICCEYFNVMFDQISNKSRRRPFVYMRQVVMYFICNEGRLMYLNEIGDMFGGRDHSTVIHAKRTIEDLMFSDPNVKKDIENIQSIISLSNPLKKVI